MKVVLAVAVVASLASHSSAFVTPSAKFAGTALKEASYLDDPGWEGMVGVSQETGNKLWDPAGIRQFIPAERAREAELANGRVSMLATVGWVAPSIFGTWDSADVTTTDAVDAVLQADPQWWAQWVILCGTFEAIKYRAKLNGKSFAGGSGEPAIDYLRLYPSDKAAREELQLKELKNGRLAMLAIASFFSAHFIPGSVPALPEGF